jgi:hypothetical protein
VSFLKLGFSKCGEVLEEDGAYGLFPGEVDELLVGLDGVRDSRGAGEKEGTKDGGTKERPAQLRWAGCRCLESWEHS